MAAPAPSAWFPNLLRRSSYLTAALLAGFTALAPVLHRSEDIPPAGAARATALFARDSAMRRTAVASALGLAVTAVIFFQPPGAPRVFSRRPEPPPPPPTSGVGA